MAEQATYIPEVPEEVAEEGWLNMLPSTDMDAWVRSVFMDSKSPIYNRDHDHLKEATIGYLWTNQEYIKTGRRILGQAKLGEPAGSDAWARARQTVLLRSWFGDIPDFVITIFAPYWHTSDTVSRCALIEHELYHCAQAFDAFGGPRFDREGLPVWTMRAHDVEEFVGVVRRYGTWSSELKALSEVMERGQTIARAKIEGICACGAGI